jgi:hypothetical protein
MTSLSEQQLVVPARPDPVSRRFTRISSRLGYLSNYLSDALDYHRRAIDSAQRSAQCQRMCVGVYKSRKHRRTIQVDRLIATPKVLVLREHSFDTSVLDQHGCSNRITSIKCEDVSVEEDRTA